MERVFNIYDKRRMSFFLARNRTPPSIQDSGCTHGTLTASLIADVCVVV
jgi:hypothetical protein